MRATIAGLVVKAVSEPWEMNGKTGIAHAYYLRDPSIPESSAQRVRVATSEMLPKDGATLRAVVDIFAQGSDFGGAAKLRVTHVEYVDEKPQAQVRPHAV